MANCIIYLSDELANKLDFFSNDKFRETYSNRLNCQIKQTTFYVFIYKAKPLKRWCWPNCLFLFFLYGLRASELSQVKYVQFLCGRTSNLD